MKAFAEAEAHKGVSLIVAYAPCVMQVGVAELGANTWQLSNCSQRCALCTCCWLLCLLNPFCRPFSVSLIRNVVMPHTSQRNPQGIADGMSCAVNEARLAVETGYWPLWRYTPETDLPTTTDEVGWCIQ